MIDGQNGLSADLYSKTPVVGRGCFRLVAFCTVRLASCSLEPLSSAMAPGTKPKSKVAVPTAAEGDERAESHTGNTARVSWTQASKAWSLRKLQYMREHEIKPAWHDARFLGVQAATLGSWYA